MIINERSTCCLAGTSTRSYSNGRSREVRLTFSLRMRRYMHPGTSPSVRSTQRPGHDPAITENLLPATLRELFHGRPANPNPRCLLAIEVCYSGSSKHIMGDLLNAGSLGLFGLVVGDDSHMPKIRRIWRYIELLAELGKGPWLFRNVVSISTSEFDCLLR